MLHKKKSQVILFSLLILFLCLPVNCGGNRQNIPSSVIDSGSNPTSTSTPNPNNKTFNYEVTGLAQNIDTVTLIARSCQSSYSSSYFNINSGVISSKQLPQKRLRSYKEISVPLQDLPPDVEAKYEQKFNELLRAGKIPKLGQKISKTPKAAYDYFYVVNNGIFRKIGANRLASGNYCQVYVQEGLWLTSVDAEKIVTAFEVSNPFSPGKGIYQRTREIFGAEPETGIDGEQKTTILILDSNTIGSLGYFYSIDFAPSSSFMYSNECKIIYLVDYIFQGNQFSGLATIAHEFQHLICFNQKNLINNNGKTELKVFNEGRSVLSEHLNGFTMSAGNYMLLSKINAFENEPDKASLLESSPKLCDYGMGFLLMMFIYDKYGGQSTIYNISTSRDTGPSSVQTVTSTPFNDLFARWALVNIYDSLGGSPPMKYNSISMTKTYYNHYNTNNTIISSVYLAGINPFVVSSYPASGQYAIRPWGVTYVRFDNAGGLLTINGYAPSVFELETNIVVERPKGTFNSVK